MYREGVTLNESLKSNLCGQVILVEPLFGCSSFHLAREHRLHDAKTGIYDLRVLRILYDICHLGDEHFVDNWEGLGHRQHSLLKRIVYKLLLVLTVASCIARY